MERLQKYGFVIFAFGTVLSTSIYANDLGFRIHVQKYFHFATYFRFLDSYGFIFFLTSACIPIGLALIMLKAKKIQMKQMIKPFAGIFLVTAVFAGVAYALPNADNSNDILLSEWKIIHDERIAIQGVNYDSEHNILSLYVQGVNDIGENATFTNINIKSPSGKIVTSIPSSYKLTDNTLKTITINNCILTSGSYIVTLNTANGGSFVSPNFKVP